MNTIVNAPQTLNWYSTRPLVANRPAMIHSGELLIRRLNWATMRFESCSTLAHTEIERISEGGVRTGARNRDQASSFLCSWGGPYSFSETSISPIISLNKEVEIRARSISKVGASRSRPSGSRPTSGAIKMKVTLLKHTSSPRSGSSVNRAWKRVGHSQSVTLQFTHDFGQIKLVAIDKVK